MIGKIIAGSSCAGTVGYVINRCRLKDGVRMTDAWMRDITKKYMQRMGITDTQYLLVRHLDQPHPHCHLVYNRVENSGQTLSDKNIKIRNAKVCRALTEQYGLHLALGKESVRRERLREPDKTKYNIRRKVQLEEQARRKEREANRLDEKCFPPEKQISFQIDF